MPRTEGPTPLITSAQQFIDLASSPGNDRCLAISPILNLEGTTKFASPDSQTYTTRISNQKGMIGTSVGFHRARLETEDIEMIAFAFQPKKWFYTPQPQVHLRLIGADKKEPTDSGSFATFTWAGVSVEPRMKTGRIWYPIAPVPSRLLFGPFVADQIYQQIVRMPEGDFDRALWEQYLKKSIPHDAHTAVALALKDRKKPD